MLLQDFADYGNAGVSPAPDTLAAVDVAPRSHAFETRPGDERLYTLMNHELVHVATDDIASERGPPLARASFSARSRRNRDIPSRCSTTI